MLKFIRKDQFYYHSHYKIRQIKADLASETKLPISEIHFVYKNIILEDHQRINHYKIDGSRMIWFGTLNEYNEEFGDHIVLKLKANHAPDSMNVTEKILIKKTEPISQIRSYLSHIYSWIEKVKFSNIEMKQLLDDEIIENCNLIENPIVIIGSPVLVVTKGSNLEDHNNVPVPMTYMRLNAYELSPLMEVFRKITSHNKTKGCLLLRILNLIKMSPNRQSIKHEFIALISDWVKYFDKVDAGNLTQDEVKSMFKQDFSNDFENGELGIQLSTSDKHLLEMKKMVIMVDKIFSKCFPKQFSDLFQKTLSSIKTIMETFLQNIKGSDFDRKFVDLRLVKSINYYLENFLKEGSSLQEREIYSQLIELLPDILPIICDINSIIYDYWQSQFYNKEKKFHEFYVNPNLSRDNPIQIMSATELTAKDAKDILSANYMAQDHLLIKREIEYIYGDEEKLPNGETVFSVSVSRPNNLKKFEKLGQGGYGSVFIYKNELTGQEMVLKKLKIPFKKKLEDTTEIIREIITFSRLGPHKRIIQYLGYYLEKRSFFIEMEYMKGGSLKIYLNKTGPLDVTEIRHFSSQILEGLKYLHDRTIFHRDIKAENVLLSENLDVKLTDFGLAKCFYGSKEDYQTGYKQSQGGTERWMAPEICITGIFGAPADIWSFGVTVIEMVTANPPYPDLPATAAQIKIATTGKIDFSVPVNVNLQMFIDSCLKNSPADRLTVDELLASKFINE